MPAMVGELIAGRYELEELVGTGGMSSVYRAQDRLLERKVAIKLLHEHHSADAAYVERFRREARAAAKLSHPNIVTVIDRGEADGRQFIVFEYVDGKNLRRSTPFMRGLRPAPHPWLQQGVSQIIVADIPARHVRADFWKTLNGRENTLNRRVPLNAGTAGAI